MKPFSYSPAHRKIQVGRSVNDVQYPSWKGKLEAGIPCDLAQ